MIVLSPSLYLTFIQAASSFYSTPERLELPAEPNLALLAEQVEDVATWRSFGTLAGRLDSDDEPAVYEVDSEGGYVQVTFRLGDPFDARMLEVALAEEGARCAVWYQTDVPDNHSITDVGGLALLATDGERVFLEVEAYATGFSGIQSYLARVEVGAEGLELARRLLPRSAEIDPSPTTSCSRRKTRSHARSSRATG